VEIESLLYSQILYQRSNRSQASENAVTVMLEYFVAKVHFNIISLMSTTWVSHIKCCDEHKIDVTVNFQVFEVEDLGIAMDYGL